MGAAHALEFAPEDAEHALALLAGRAGNGGPQRDDDAARMAPRTLGSLNGHGRPRQVLDYQRRADDLLSSHVVNGGTQPMAGFVLAFLDAFRQK